MGSCSSSCTSRRRRERTQRVHSNQGTDTQDNQDHLTVLSLEDQLEQEEDSQLYQISTNLTAQHNYNSLSSSYSYYVPPTGKNKRIKKEFYNKYFKFDKKITEEQLTAKRDEFWDTAPAFDGKLEIWNALKAAVDAAENKNFQLAQAIIDSANIILPNGYLNDCYDELGNRYQIPIYVLTKPINIVKSLNTGSDDKDSLCLDDESIKLKDKKKIKKGKKKAKGDEDEDNDSKKAQLKIELNAKEDALAPKVDDLFQIKLRVSNSNNENDMKVNVTNNQTVSQLKTQIKDLIQVETSSLRLYFGGKALKDREKLKAYKLRKNVVLQVIVKEV